MLLGMFISGIVHFVQTNGTISLSLSLSLSFTCPCPGSKKSRSCLTIELSQVVSTSPLLSSPVLSSPAGREGKGQSTQVTFLLSSCYDIDWWSPLTWLIDPRGSLISMISIFLPSGRVILIVILAHYQYSIYSDSRWGSINN